MKFTENIESSAIGWGLWCGFFIGFLEPLAGGNELAFGTTLAFITGFFYANHFRNTNKP